MKSAHLAFVAALLMVAAAPAAAQAFPGAVGWAAETKGGRGGAIARVTNLNADGGRGRSRPR